MLANIISIPRYKKINSKSPIAKIELYLNPAKDYSTLENGKERFSASFIAKFRELILIPLFNKFFLNETVYPLVDSFTQKYAEIYLIHKLISIPEKYKSFQDFNRRVRKKDSGDNYRLIPENAREYVNSLYEDRSHITLKVRQTLNFLRKDIFGIPKNGDLTRGIDLNLVIKKIATIIEQDWFTETIDYLPPPFYLAELNLKMAVISMN